MGDYRGILWYLGQTSDHSLQSILEGCFRVQVTLGPVNFSSVYWHNYSSYQSVLCLIFC
jgi:hypothetical protein